MKGYFSLVKRIMESSLHLSRPPSDLREMHGGPSSIFGIWGSHVPGRSRSREAVSAQRVTCQQLLCFGALFNFLTLLVFGRSLQSFPSSIAPPLLHHYVFLSSWVAQTVTQKKVVKNNEGRPEGALRGKERQFLHFPKLFASKNFEKLDFQRSARLRSS